MKNISRQIVRNGSSLLLIAAFAGIAAAAQPASTMTRAEAKELIASSSTAADHHRLALYFTQKADNMEAEAVEHDELAAEYTKHPGIHDMKHTMSAKTAGHCRYFAQQARKAGAEDRALAAAHEAMAADAGK